MREFRGCELNNMYYNHVIHPKGNLRNFRAFMNEIACIVQMHLILIQFSHSYYDRDSMLKG